MKTQIFKSYDEFLSTAHVSVNGCTQEFLDKNNLTLEQFVEMNETNYSCWCCIDCIDCVRCVECTRCDNCTRCERCVYCDRCTYCVYCDCCVYCDECTDCASCKDCVDIIGK